MDVALFDALDELKHRPEIRAVIWRGEGKAWSSGRDVGSIGQKDLPMSHHDLMARGHRGILAIFEIQAPIIVPIQGWAIGGSFQRALLCDIRIAAEGARFMLPEVGHGVIPDTGGVARLYQMCGHGVASDMVLTGRAMDAQEALAHGIGASPAVTVKIARRVIRHLSEAEVRSSMEEELIGQTFINKSDDFAEFRA